jgi:hypothetical protein
VAALGQVGAEHDTKRQALPLALETARYEAQRAWRHDARVAPGQRLVAGAREHRWHEALGRVTEVEAPLATRQRQRRTRSEEQRQGLRTLGQALRVVWQPPSAPEALKKRLLRTVLQAMMIHTTPEPPEPIFPLHWPGGVHTELRGARKTAGPHGRATAHDSMAVIRALSKVWRALTIAATLHRLGYRPGTGQTWRAPRVAGVRYQ